MPQPRNPARYHVLGEHGRGGLGKVSRAHDLELGRDVAIKELLSRSAMHEVRFMREALITARLEHPGIVPVHEAGRWPDGTPFYAMKLVAGRPLRDLLAERKTVDERLALLHHVIAVADAIAYAHGRNIIHRDLKPSNVIVGDFGETVVIDWGLAKDLSSSEESTTGGSPLPIIRDDELTSAGTVLGTPAYMAPEQRRGEPVDQRADVYAIGAMLWELCSLEKLPSSDAGRRSRILRSSGIDPDLGAIVDKSLDPDPDRRYADAGAVAADLKAFKAGIRIGARRYSLPALLRHWIRRNRLLASSAATTIAAITLGVCFYLFGIASEHQKTREALNKAQQERDRARLSEASVILEKDPNAARDLLDSMSADSQQYALLVSRAKQRSAAHVLQVNTGVTGLFIEPHSSKPLLITREGELNEIDSTNGSMHAIDHNLTGAITRDGQGWLYVRKGFGQRSAELSRPTTGRAGDLGHLSSILSLAFANGALYALDTSHDLYRIGSGGPRLIQHGVHNITASNDLLLMCLSDGTLKILKADVFTVRHECHRTTSPQSIAVADNDYATILASGILLTSRAGQETEIPTGIIGEYELALSKIGTIAIADYGATTRTWYVHPGSNSLLPGPLHTSRLLSVATDGTLAAWGYADGLIIVLDTLNGQTWTLKGHSDGVEHLICDSRRSQLISASAQDLRVWNLPSRSTFTIASVPCSIFHIQPSPDRSQVAFDCSDGSVWRWSRKEEIVRQIHKHNDISYGIQWLHDMICSAGWDGRVICTAPNGAHVEYSPKSGKITSLVASPAGDALFFSSSEGQVWKADKQLIRLYSHGSMPYRVAISPDGKQLVSGDISGLLAFFDLSEGRIAHAIAAHAAPIRAIQWQDGFIWSTGRDNTLRKWTSKPDILALCQSTTEINAFRITAIFSGGWATSIGESSLLLKDSKQATYLRLNMGKRVNAIAASANGRYIAVGIHGEVVILDIFKQQLTSLDLDYISEGGIAFIDDLSLAINTAKALELVQVDKLDYTAFTNR